MRPDEEYVESLDGMTGAKKEETARRWMVEAGEGKKRSQQRRASRERRSEKCSSQPPSCRWIVQAIAAPHSRVHDNCRESEVEERKGQVRKVNGRPEGTAGVRPAARPVHSYCWPSAEYGAPTRSRETRA